jgi:hypothetical protein
MAQPTQGSVYCQCPPNEDVAETSDPDGVLLCGRCYRDIRPTDRATNIDTPDRVITADDEKQLAADKAVYEVLKSKATFLKCCIRSPTLDTITTAFAKHCKKSPMLRELREDYGQEESCASIARLIEEGIFSSHEKARMRFPNRFEDESISASGKTAISVEEERIPRKFPSTFSLYLLNI